jgi:DNA-binding transcriptional regulator YiaG
MPNLSSVLKSEITRLARKEVKGAVDPLRKANASYRREIAELKRQILMLHREVKSSNRASTQRIDTETEPRKTRFAAGGLKSLRSRLGLSASDFGRLIGASGQSVYNWEAGKAVPRSSQQAALASIRGLGKREAARRLEAMV